MRNIVKRIDLFYKVQFNMRKNFSQILPTNNRNLFRSKKAPNNLMFNRLTFRHLFFRKVQRAAACARTYIKVLPQVINTLANRLT